MYARERSLVKKLADKPFVLLGVNSDDEREKVKTVIEKEQMTWRSWWDGGSTDGPISTAYNVFAWPTIYVLDHEGVIRYINIDLHEEKLEDTIDGLLAEMEKKEKGK
jgi:hypothetical protein